MLIFSVAEMLNKLTAEQTVPGIRAPGPLLVDYGCLVLIRYELKFDDRLLSKSSSCDTFDLYRAQETWD